MNCQIPHYRPKAKKKEAHHNNRDYELEDMCLQDARTTCPVLTVDLDSGRLINQSVGINLPVKKFQGRTTLPVALFPPTNVRCGSGPTACNARDPHESAHASAYLRLVVDVRNLIKGLKRDSEKAKKNGQNEEHYCQREGQSMIQFIERILPTGNMYMDTLLTNFNNYCKDLKKTPVAPFSGTNLINIQSGSDRYLVYSTPENGGTLCMVMAPKNDSYHPDHSGIIKCVTGHQIYQISQPKKRYRQDGHEENAAMFVTRSLNGSTVWANRNWMSQAQNRIGHGQNWTSHNQNWTDPTFPFSGIVNTWDDGSVVKCVDMNPFILGEFCELRDDSVTVQCLNKLVHRQKLDRAYNSCHYSGRHPREVFLVGDQKIDKLDLRSNPATINTVFSLDNERLNIYYNMSPNQKIQCIAQCHVENTWCICTEKFLIVWDHTMRNTPLYKTTHMMNSYPAFASSVVHDQDNHEWILLNSKTGRSSCATALRWDERRLCSSGPLGFRDARLEIAPIRTSCLSDTLEQMNSKGQLLDWPVRNRFKQSITGVTCYLEGDQIRNWICTGAGDIFLQNIHISHVASDSGDQFSHTDGTWVRGWEQAACLIEDERPVPCATEIYGSNTLISAMYRDQPGVCREPVKGEKISVDDIMKTKDKRSRSYLKVWEEGEDGEWDKLGTFESRSNKTTK